MALTYLFRLMGSSLPSRLMWERRVYRQELMEDISGRKARGAFPVVTVATVIGLTALSLAWVMSRSRLWRGRAY